MPMPILLETDTRVQAGGRVEVATSDLPEGATVHVTVALLDPATYTGNGSHHAPLPAPAATPMGIWDWLQTLPPGPRSAPTWEEIERNFQEERNSWDR